MLQAIRSNRNKMLLLPQRLKYCMKKRSRAAAQASAFCIFLKLFQPSPQMTTILMTVWLVPGKTLHEVVVLYVLKACLSLVNMLDLNRPKSSTVISQKMPCRVLNHIGATFASVL
jgi:hypothetical protein